jgi:hypothetical protein
MPRALNRFPLFINKEPMKNLQIITSTGNGQADKIFKGVFGEIDEQGSFQIAPELKGIHLFNLLTPEALAQQGIDLSRNLVVIGIDEKDESAIKATLMNVLRGSWLKTYDQVDMAPGFAKAALDSERAGVDKAIQAAIDGMNLQRLDVQVEAAFVNQPSTYGDDYGDDYGDEGEDSGGDRLTISAADIARQVQWKMSTTPADSATAAASIQSSNTSNDYATGQIVGEMTIYAAGVGQASAVVAAVNQAVAALGGQHQFVKEPMITAAQWHPYTPVQAAADASAESIETAESIGDVEPAPGA